MKRRHVLKLSDALHIERESVVIRKIFEKLKKLTSLIKKEKDNKAKEKREKANEVILGRVGRGLQII